MVSACNVQVDTGLDDPGTVTISADEDTGVVTVSTDGTDTGEQTDDVVSTDGETSSDDQSSSGDETETTDDTGSEETAGSSVDFVSPYIAVAGTSQEVIISGTGFMEETINSISFGESLATEIDVRSDTEIRATFPALAAGTYAVQVDSVTGAINSGAELVVVNSEVFEGAAPAIDGAKNNLLYDAERKAIYALEYQHGDLERLRLVDGSWQSDQLALDDIRDIALSPNGDQIIAVTPQAIVHINADSFTVEETIAGPTLSDAAMFLDNIAMANNGTALISLDSSNGSSTGVYAYSLTDKTFSMLVDAGGPWELAATENGSRVIIAAEPGTDATVYEYLAASGELALTALATTSERVIADRTGQYFLLGGETDLSLYDSQLQPLGGSFPVSSAFSPDGDRLYVYKQPDTIAVYDLANVDAQTGLTLLGSFKLSTSPGGAIEFVDEMEKATESSQVFMRVTPDDQNLILSGGDNVVVTPILELTSGDLVSDNEGDSGSDSGSGGDGGCTSHCDRPWEALVDNVIGFGADTTGGMGADLCHVTNLNNSGSGSLRACAEKSAAAWIVFDVSGVIKLSDEIRVNSNKTIDGRGQRITLTNFGLTISGSENVIVHNIRIDGAPSGTERDAISIINDAKRVWIDHCELTDFTDGLLDITVRSTDITASWNHLYNHKNAVLISASDSHTFDSVIRVTMHHNYLHDMSERHPRVRFGKVHVFNNLIKDWGYYGVRTSIDAQVVVEDNIFEAGSSSTAIEVHMDGAVRATDNLLLNGARVVQNKASSVFDPSDYYSYSPDAANSALQSTLETATGWQDVPFPN